MTRAPSRFTRRNFLSSASVFTVGAAAGTSDMQAAYAQAVPASNAPTQSIQPQASVTRHKGVVTRNTASFRTLDWRPFFDNLNNGAVLCDIESRALHFWSEDESIYRLFPTSVPLSEDLTRRGRTRITRKVNGPSWAPTPAMKKRNPDWPDRIPAGPSNPLGTHALYLSWTYYRIHGTHDTRKIGRRSSNGCIGLYNEHIAALFDLVKTGTQVVLI